MVDRTVEDCIEAIESERRVGTRVEIVFFGEKHPRVDLGQIQYHLKAQRDRIAELEGDMEKILSALPYPQFFKDKVAAVACLQGTVNAISPIVQKYVPVVPKAEETP